MVLVEKCEVAVDFDGKSMKVDTAEDAKNILDALENNPSMNVICLSGNTIGVDGARSIGSKLLVHKDLKRCIFSDMFTGRMVDEIAPALREISVGIMSSFAQLTELDLSDNAFGPRGIVGVTDLLSSPACFTLKILRMNNQGLGHEGARYLAEALSKGMDESNGKGLRLTHFSAGRNRLENVGVCYLADVFSRMQSLEELYLFQNGIGIHGFDGIKALASAISKNPHMRVINLSDNTLKAEGGVEIAKILKSIPQLKELILDDCLIRSQGCRALANCLDREDIVPSLCRLSLYGNDIRHQAAVSLAFSLGTKANLTHLSLNGNEFGPTGVKNVIRALDSVSLLPAIEAGLSPTSEEEFDDDDSEDMNVYSRAFNEDAGSDNDGDVDEEEDEFEFDDDYDEALEGSDDKVEDEDDELENSFAALKGTSNRPSDESVRQSGTSGADGFSFLSCLSNLNRENQAKPNLFAGLSAPALSVGLFGKTPSAPISSGLFAPPKLNVSVSPATPTSLASMPSNSTPFDDTSILDLLKVAFADTENDSLLTTVIDEVVKQSPPSYWRIKSEAVLSAPPESIVRLAFRVYQRSTVSVCRNLACNLLLIALIRKGCVSLTSIVPPSAIAVNQVLLHLGVIKPDRSDSIERKIHTETTDSQILSTNIDLVGLLLKHHSDQLGDDIRRPLTLLISQHRKQNSALEPLLDALEEKMSTLSLSK